MTKTEWRAYFQQNRHDRVPIAWGEGGRLPSSQKRELAAVAWHLEHDLCPEAGELYAAERRQDAALLRRLVGNTQFRRPLMNDLVALRILQHETGDPVVQAVCRQVRHDLAFQVRFRCECRGKPCPDEVLALTSNADGPKPRRKRRYWPRELREAPHLDSNLQAGPIAPRTALLINPFYAKDPHASFGKHVLTPTLALSSFAGATPADWEVRYWDENLLQGAPPFEPMPEVAAITVHLTFARRAFELADWYRARGAKVVLGGLHALSCPEECAPHADSLAIGEGVQVWPEILRDVEAGTLQREYRADFRRPYREDPAPQRSIVPRWGFLTTASVIATRGCHNRCGFCYLSTDGLFMPYQMRDVEQVTGEIYDSGEPYGVFIDNNLGSRPDYLRRLCRALRPLEIIWSAAVTLDVTDQPSLVREMALAGCTGVFIGLESLTNENLADAHKKTPRTEEYARRVAILHDNGIQANGSFVLGFDHDRRDCFARTVEWIEANRLECATFHILTPYPGTPLFRQMEAEGRLLHRDWGRYDTAHVVFRPRHMLPEELAEGYAWCYETLFSHRSIWRRRPGDASAVLPYLAMAYLYKRSNLFWHFLIRHRLTHAVWRPIVEVTRRRHVGFRRRLAAKTNDVRAPAAGAVVPAGV